MVDNKKMLMTRWILHIADFGKVKRADIKVSPLTLFVGDNNSGKGYLMTLIYGILNVQFYFDKFNYDEKSVNFINCKKIIDEMFHSEMEEYKINKENMQFFQNFLNEILKINREKFVSTLFNKSIPLKNIEISFPENIFLPFVIKNVKKTIAGEKTDKPVYVISRTDVDNPISYSAEYSYEDFSNDNNAYFFFIAYIMQTMLNPFLYAQNTSKIYLPTARTGFLLTYKLVVKKALQGNLSASESEKNPLSKPCSDFLQNLTTFQTETMTNKYADIIKMLEDNVIDGKLSVSNEPSHDISYIPDKSDIPLPLHVTSGVVTEMTPLLLFLKYIDIATLMIEEPEISLHPNLQKEIARCLIQIMNSGVPVFVTTHSDIILQQINNMIKLNVFTNGKGSRNLEYKNVDLLCSDDVSVYQFDVKNNKTTVKTLQCGDYGFEAMSFYNALKEMSDEIDFIESLEKVDD